MERLKGFQRKHLRGLAHKMKPLVLVGQRGITDAVARSADEALKKHELIKLKFVDLKEKEEKKRAIAALEKMTESEMVGTIGHTAVFFRQHDDPEKRRIELPERKG
jgi:RNA-binding protein